MNDLLERLADRGAPVGADVMIYRVERELAGVSPATARRAIRPWLAGAAAASLVLLVIGGGTWLARGGDDRPAPAGLPTETLAWPEFEMWYETLNPGQEPAASVEAALDDRHHVERVLYHSPEEWRREALEPAGGLAGEVSIRSGEAIHDGHHHDLGRATSPPTPRAGGMMIRAWLGEIAPSLAWTRARPLDDSEPRPVEPTHPLAAYAAQSDRMRMEFTADGIPVMLESDEGTRYWVLRIERRPVPVDEIGAGLGVLGEGRGPAAPGDVVRRVEGDGFTGELVVAPGCVNVIVRSSGTMLMAGGGCEPSLDSAGESILDNAGVALPDGRWLSLYMGGPATAFTRIEVSHPDGGVYVDDLVDGYWLVAVPSEEQPDLVRIRALDAAGLEVSAGEIEAPPLGP